MIRSNFLKVLVIFCCIQSFSKVQAQGTSSDQSPLQLRNSLNTVLIAGLVGGVLGLSTLSFYDEPQVHIKNIFFGAGAAMMIASVIMTAEVAEAPLPTTGIKIYENSSGAAAFVLPDYNLIQKQGSIHLAVHF